MKPIVFALSLSLLLNVGQANAGLQDALDGMFMTNVTSAQAYNSQTRGGFVGGGAALRTPIRNINLVAFDPPRFSAGCGGIDLYGGSFTFINSEQLTALFRQIASNSIGALFHLAIKSINPQLAQLMTEFQSKLQALNSMFKNTCAIANQIVKGFDDPDSRKNTSDEKATKEDSGKGFFSDLFASISDLFSSPNASSKRNSESCATCGNLVWKALSDTNAGQYLGNPATGESSPDMANQIVMSLLGTIVMPGQQPDETNPDGSPKPQTGKPISYALSLGDLRDGSSKKPLKFLRCDTTEREGCLNPTLADLSFEGTLGYTNRMLFGAANENDGVQPSSILGLLSTCNTSDCGFTAQHKAFINAVSAPVLKMLRDVQASPGAMVVVAQQLAPVIADELAARYGEAALKAARQAFSGASGVTKPDDIARREQELFSEWVKQQEIVASQTDRVLKAKQYVAAVISSNPAVFAQVAKR